MKLFIFLIILSNFFVHDIHLSVCELTAIENDKIEIKLKIFYDDLQLAMGLIPGEELPKKYKSADEMIVKYVMKKLSINVDGVKAEFDYIKTEAAMPAIWTTLQLKNINASSIKTIKIQNRILIDIYDDQENIVHVKLKKAESYKLNKRQTEAAYKQ